MLGEKLFIAFLGSILGGCIGYFVQYYRAALSEELTLLNDHIKDLEKFGEQSVKYWTESYKTSTENQSCAARVMATHYACFHLYDTVIEHCNARADEYIRLSQKLTQLATGGSFDSEKHNPEPERVSDIVATLSDLIHVLRLSRTYVISPRRTIKLCIKWFAEGISNALSPKRPWLDDEVA